MHVRLSERLGTGTLITSEGVSSKIVEKITKPIHLRWIYMSNHSPGLVQALWWTVARLAGKLLKTNDKTNTHQTNIHVQSPTWVSAGTLMNSGGVSSKIVKKMTKPIHLRRIYMSNHSPGLVQTLWWNVAW